MVDGEWDGWRRPRSSSPGFRDHLLEVHGSEGHVNLLRLDLRHFDRLAYQLVEAIGFFLDDGRAAHAGRPR